MLLYVALFQHNKLIQQKPVFISFFLLVVHFVVFMQFLCIMSIFMQFTLNFFSYRKKPWIFFAFVQFPRLYYLLCSLASSFGLILFFLLEIYCSFRRSATMSTSPAPRIIITSPALAISLIFSPPSRNLSRIRRGARFRRRI